MTSSSFLGYPPGLDSMLNDSQQSSGNQPTLHSNQTLASFLCAGVFMLSVVIATLLRPHFKVFPFYFSYIHCYWVWLFWANSYADFPGLTVTSDDVIVSCDGDADSTLTDARASVPPSAGREGMHDSQLSFLFCVCFLPVELTFFCRTTDDRCCSVWTSFAVSFSPSSFSLHLV